MDTKELEARLKTLDQTVSNLGRSVQNMRNSISQCYAQAQSLESRAQVMMSMAASKEDPMDASYLYSQASACRSQASTYWNQAESLRSQIAGVIMDLNSYKKDYKYYMEEGNNNLASLNIAAEQLMGMSTAKYGATKIKEALMATKQRIVYNQNLVTGCQKRIQWIEQLCGSEGDADVKVKRR